MSILEGYDGVDFVDVVQAVPEHSCEVVGVWRIVHFDFMTESSMLRESVHLSFVIHHLLENRKKTSHAVVCHKI